MKSNLQGKKITIEISGKSSTKIKIFADDKELKFVKKLKLNADADNSIFDFEINNFIYDPSVMYISETIDQYSFFKE